MGRQIGDYIGKFVESDHNNFTGHWRSYMRIRVKLDVRRPLKRRMKIKKEGSDWCWVNFKYERLPSFCYYCGLMGHSDFFCIKMLQNDVMEAPRPYGLFMKASTKRQHYNTGNKWLRFESPDGEVLTADKRPVNIRQDQNVVGGDSQAGLKAPSWEGNQSVQIRQDSSLAKSVAIIDKANILNLNEVVDLGNTQKSTVQGDHQECIVVIEQKRRRQNNEVADVMEIGPDNNSVALGQIVSKNLSGAGAVNQARRDQRVPLAGTVVGWATHGQFRSLWTWCP